VSKKTPSMARPSKQVAQKRRGRRASPQLKRRK
jgi:hypothetical protein